MTTLQEYLTEHNYIKKSWFKNELYCGDLKQFISDIELAVTKNDILLNESDYIFLTNTIMKDDLFLFLLKLLRKNNIGEPHNFSIINKIKYHRSFQIFKEVHEMGYNYTGETFTDLLVSVTDYEKCKYMLEQGVDFDPKNWDQWHQIVERGYNGAKIMAWMIEQNIGPTPEQIEKLWKEVDTTIYFSELLDFLSQNVLPIPESVSIYIKIIVQEGKILKDLEQELYFVREEKFDEIKNSIKKRFEKIHKLIKKSI